MGKSITKKELVYQLAEVTGLPIRRCRLLVSLVFSIIQSSIAKGEEVHLPNLGVISTKESPGTRRLWRLEKIVTQFKDKKRIKFKPYK